MTREDEKESMEEIIALSHYDHEWGEWKLDKQFTESKIYPKSMPTTNFNIWEKEE